MCCVWKLKLLRYTVLHVSTSVSNKVPMQIKGIKEENWYITKQLYYLLKCWAHKTRTTAKIQQNKYEDCPQRKKKKVSSSKKKKVAKMKKQQTWNTEGLYSSLVHILSFIFYKFLRTKNIL